jgi:hypothetical protein
LKAYSPAGVATSETTLPFSKAFDGGETVPPFNGVQSTVSFCWITSLEQEKTNKDNAKMDIRSNMFNWFIELGKPN